MTNEIVIAGRHVGPDHAPYVIAEMSGNHNGDIERAKALISAAAEAGADAVKLQTYTADTITIRSDRPEFQIADGLWKGRSLYELYEEAHTPWDWHPALFEHARACGITAFSSPFDPSAVAFLEELGAPAYKIASPEVIDWGLLKTVAQTGKPIIISSGMATDQEMREAIDVLQQNGAGGIIALHCISAYPTPIEQANVRRVQRLSEMLGIPSGLSDHSMGLTVPMTAVALGACAVEKHFTLARADGGVDSAFSLEKGELAELCTAVRDVYSTLGDGRLEVADAEAGTCQFRRSLYFVAPLSKGDIITVENVRSIRPGLGLLPRHLDELVGRRASVDIAAGTPVDWDLVSE